ncbi:PilW family protein [Geothermobacter hydrogeniphilus]|nr:prepilin-type N-terminal cleavage/methylation domain-containing protein [Geothermobacter hydrogeniphilus]
MRAAGRRQTDSNHRAGFTLLELLIGIAITGIALAAIYSLYLTMQNTTSDQARIVDSQQNLRVAMDFISRDLSMAGAIIYRNTPGIAAGSDASTLTINTASSSGAFALISSSLEVPKSATTTSNQAFTVEVPAMVDRFKVGDSVRIYRPQSGSQPYSALPLTVQSLSGIRTITIAGFGSLAEPIQYNAGDVIVRIGAGAPDPSSITWTLNGTDLTRQADNGGQQVVADNISQLQFDYILSDGTEVAAPSASQLADISAVRVTLVSTTAKQASQQNRQRSLSDVVHLRNH